jgi:hypothetical protein
VDALQALEQMIPTAPSTRPSDGRPLTGQSQQPLMNATSDAGSDAVTVTCQASFRELRAAMSWMYRHDPAFLDQLFKPGGLYNAGPLVWLVGLAISPLIFAFRAWRRTQAEGPTTLTVSPSGLSWYNSKQRKEAGWDQYDGYVVLPDVLIFVWKAFVVPRSTVSPIDFERVLSIAKRHLQPVDSSTGRISPASPVG